MTLELADDYVYSDGKQTFFVHSPDHPPFQWMLAKVYRVGRNIKRPMSPGDLSGYILDVDGFWHECRVAPPKQGEMVMVPCPQFEIEIMPKLKLVAKSIQGYLNGQ